MSSRSRDAQLRPVLTWEEHDRRHPRDEWSTSEGRTYVLDETDTPGVLRCGRCGSQVIAPDAEARSGGEQAQ